MFQFWGERLSVQRVECTCCVLHIFFILILKSCQRRKVSSTNRPSYLLTCLKNRLCYLLVDTVLKLQDMGSKYNLTNCIDDLFFGSTHNSILFMINF